jgi:hypothetical protein
MKLTPGWNFPKQRNVCHHTILLIVYWIVQDTSILEKELSRLNLPEKNCSVAYFPLYFHVILFVYVNGLIVMIYFCRYIHRSEQIRSMLTEKKWNPGHASTHISYFTHIEVNPELWGGQIEQSVAQYGVILILSWGTFCIHLFTLIYNSFIV